MEREKINAKKELEYYNTLRNYMKHYELQNKLNVGDIIKIISVIVISLVFLGVFILIGIMTFKSNVSIETIISLVIALFSIFMSVFFYFKADESNTKFYNSSYSFMKEVSVILGRIEERFGEKLTNMTEKLNNIEAKKQQLDNIEVDKDKILNELIEKANLNQTEKEKYKNRLNEKERESENLKRELFNIERKYRMFRNELENFKDPNKINNIYRKNDSENITSL